MEQEQTALKRVPWNPWIGVLFIVVVFVASQLFAGSIVYIYPQLKGWSSGHTSDWLSSSVIAQFLFILLAESFSIGSIYLFLRRYKLGLSAIGLGRPKLKHLLYGLSAVPVYYLLYIATVGVASSLVTGLNVNQKQEIGFSGVHGVAPLVMTFISLVVLPPLTEELMVRGFLYSSLKKAMPVVWAVILTSALFASAHLSEGGAAGPLYIAALDTFVLSLVLIYLREKTGSLWPSITLHAIKNGIAFVALFVLHSQ